jgi:hypothetical protein
MQDELRERVLENEEERTERWNELNRSRYEQEAESFRALAEAYREEMDKIKETADFLGGVLLDVMNSMAAAMVRAVEEGSNVFAALGKAALTAFADMFEALMRVAIAEIMLEQAKAAGILTMKGFLNPMNWALIAPMLAAGAAAIAAVQVVRGALKFHEGGKPPREGYYWIRENEHVIDPEKARRGGYGSTYVGALGGLEAIEIHLHDVRIADEGKPVQELAVDLADQLRGELARGGV